MKIVSNEYKNEITKVGRQYKNKINLYGDGHLATQDNRLILTENNMALLVQNSVNEVLEDDVLFNINLVRKGKILATNMKELDFESYKDIAVGNIVSYEYGLKTDFENNGYEWINYGKFIIYSKEFNEDTKTYSYICYDYMLKTMVPLPNNKGFLQNKQISSIINHIGEEFDLNTSLSTEIKNKYPNLLKRTSSDAFNNVEATYRDVLDMICQAVGTTMITDNDNLNFKSLKTNPVDTIDKRFLKDINVSFGKKYGPINSLVISRSGQTDNIYRQDTQSIEQNGLTEFKINDNLILLYNDREEYIDNIFDQINGVEYYINDFSSTGIGYLEFLDFYNIQIDENIYKCLMLDSNFKVKNGISEDINTEEPEETNTDYTTSGKTDKDVSFIVDKQTASINAKVSKGEVINEINLDSSGASINAEKISLAGKTIQLTSDNITINSTNFQVDKNGNITANNVTFNSGTFSGELNTDEDCVVGNDLYVGQNQETTDWDEKYIYFDKRQYIRRLLSGSVNSLTVVGDDYSALKTRSGDAKCQVLEDQCTIEADYIRLNSDDIRCTSEPYWPSDERLKENIKDVNVDWIDDLKVKEFVYKTNLNKNKIGLIAQDYLEKDYNKYFLEQDRDGYYAIRYTNITNALIKYCQELKQRIDTLEERINKLEEDKK